MKLARHIQKYIEGELMSYPFNKKALEQAKQNIYLRQRTTSFDLPQHSTYGTSAVEHKAIILMTERNIVHLENSVIAIEDVFKELPEEYQRLIQLRYFKSYSVERVSSELNICTRNFHNWRNKALYYFALRFGLV